MLLSMYYEGFFFLLQGFLTASNNCFILFKKNEHTSLLTYIIVINQMEGGRSRIAYGTQNVQAAVHIVLHPVRIQGIEQKR